MLNDKVAIVIGAVSGIGLGIVRALAQAGCNIMLNGFCEPAAIEHRRPQIKKDFGVRTAFNPCRRGKAGGRRRNGRVYGIELGVNNAGIQYTAPVEKFPIDRRRFAARRYRSTAAPNSREGRQS